MSETFKAQFLEGTRYKWKSSWETMIQHLAPSLFFLQLENTVSKNSTKDPDREMRRYMKT